MIKTVLFCTLLACISATQNWTGTWYVIGQLSGNLAVCDIPANLTMVNITTNGENLTMTGRAAGAQATHNWTLESKPDQQGFDYCTGDGWCISGYLIHSDGNTYANISWDLDLNPTQWCSTLLIAANESWAGEWFVTVSQPDENCDVPKEASFANIEDYGDHLLMIGTSTATHAVASWTFNFTNSEQHVTGACIDEVGTCVNADLGLQFWILIGRIRWTVDNYYDCNVTLQRWPRAGINEQSQYYLNNI